MSDLRDIITSYAEDKARELGDAFVDRARGYCSRRTGKLADSITADDPELHGTYVTVRVHVEEEYGKFQNEGTGIYGPTGQRIEPTNAQALAFDWPAAGGLVIVKSVRGSEATHFWDRTKDEFGSIVAEVAA